jgi:amino-acid N-acetyltransferase
MNIRHPRLDEVEAVHALFIDEVRAGRMLPRSLEEMSAHLDDWLIAEKYGQIAGCVSLVYFNRDLCEIRSLAVAPVHRGNGVAGKLIEAAIELARTRGMRNVLTLTRAVPVFERVGFQRDFVTHFPEKVWKDCAPCPFRQMCDETALVFPLSQETAQ